MEPTQAFEQSLMSSTPESEAVQAMALDPEWSLERLADVLEVTVDALEATDIAGMTVSFTIDDQPATGEVSPLSAIRAVAQVLRAKHNLEGGQASGE